MRRAVPLPTVTMLAAALVLAPGCGRTALERAKVVALTARQTAESAYLTVRIEWELGHVDQATMDRARSLYARFELAQRAYVNALELWERGSPRPDLEALRRQEPDWDELERMLRELEFTSLLRRLPPREPPLLRRAGPELSLPSEAQEVALSLDPDGVVLFWGGGEPVLLEWSKAPKVWERLEPLGKVGHDLKGASVELGEHATWVLEFGDK